MIAERCVRMGISANFHRGLPCAQVNIQASRLKLSSHIIGLRGVRQAQFIGTGRIVIDGRLQHEGKVSPPGFASGE